MQLVEIYQINKTHKLFKELDYLSFLAKNIYNAGNYLIRQHYLNTKNDVVSTTTNKYLNYYDVNRIMVDNQNADYIKLPRKVSNGILRLLDKNYISFFKSLKDFKTNPQKYKGHPKLPKYKDSLKGRCIVPYEKGAISKKQFKKHNVINLSGTDIKIKTRIKSWDQLQACRIVPTIYGYKIEIIYNKNVTNHNLSKENILGLDVGLNNILSGATTTNKSFVINGKPLKSINYYYNKQKGKIQSELSKRNLKTSNRLNQLTNKRNNKINHYLHCVSKRIINYCLTNNIGAVVVGHNNNWKQNINIGKINNQNFVDIPFNNLINQLKYKCELNNIIFNTTEESYTSKCSFIDNEELKQHDNYCGDRIYRGLFKSKNGVLINADINGALNIIRKVNRQFNVTNTLYYRLQGIAVYPTNLII